MFEPATTPVSNTGGFNSQLSFYEYPPHKPYINSTYQPLRPSHDLSTTAPLPESNRDQILTSLQSISSKIKALESEREKAELSFHELTGGLSRSASHRREPQITIEEQLKEAEENFRRLQTQHNRVVQVLNDQRPTTKSRTSRKKKRSSQSHNHSLDSGTNTDGRHHHLDLNHVPFILGQSTAPSHNVKTNVQNVIALLKNHNHQLCLSSKEYTDLLHPRQKSEISPHTLLYLDHYGKQSTRPSSSSPVRAPRRSTSSTRRPQTASVSSVSDNQCYSRIKSLRREYVILSREHARLNSSDGAVDDLEIIGRRMDAILEELGQLQRRYMMTSQDRMEQDLNETPIETLRRTKLLQLILRDPISKHQKH